MQFTPFPFLERSFLIAEPQRREPSLCPQQRASKNWGAVFQDSTPHQKVEESWNKTFKTKLQLAPFVFFALSNAVPMSEEGDPHRGPYFSPCPRKELRMTAGFICCSEEMDCGEVLPFIHHAGVALLRDRDECYGLT